MALLSGRNNYFSADVAQVGARVTRAARLSAYNFASSPFARNLFLARNLDAIIANLRVDFSYFATRYRLSTRSVSPFIIISAVAPQKFERRFVSSMRREAGKSRSREEMGYLRERKAKFLERLSANRRNAN